MLRSNRKISRNLLISNRLCFSFGFGPLRADSETEQKRNRRYSSVLSGVSSEWYVEIDFQHTTRYTGLYPYLSGPDWPYLGY